MVTGVEEYFKILEELQKNNTTLPINIQSGESFFDVDLNDRLIIVPPEFKKYIAVQRDHNIETIYFRVDRYFDTTDLSELTCVVQFTNARKESGIHLVSEKDLTTYSSDGKMILGWKLNRDLTQYPGTVTYSLRFYRLDENKKFIYDLHTIPAIGIIAPGLDTLEDTNAEEDTKPVANLITDLINRVDYACGPEMNGMMKNNINEYFAENPVKEEIREYLTENPFDATEQIEEYLGKISLFFETMPTDEELISLPDNAYFTTKGYYTNLDGAGSTYFITKERISCAKKITLTDNDGNIIETRYLRDTSELNNGKINLLHYGLKRVMKNDDLSNEEKNAYGKINNDIWNSIDNCDTNNPIIYIPAGTYYFNEPIKASQITSSNAMTLVGDGAISRMFMGTKGATILAFHSLKDNEIAITINLGGARNLSIIGEQYSISFDRSKCIDEPDNVITEVYDVMTTGMSFGGGTLENVSVNGFYTGINIKTTNSYNNMLRFSNCHYGLVCGNDNKFIGLYGWNVYTLFKPLWAIVSATQLRVDSCVHVIEIDYMTGLQITDLDGDWCTGSLIHINGSLKNSSLKGIMGRHSCLAIYDSSTEEFVKPSDINVDDYLKYGLISMKTSAVLSNNYIECTATASNPLDSSSNYRTSPIIISAHKFCAIDNTTIRVNQDIFSPTEQYAKDICFIGGTNNIIKFTIESGKGRVTYNKNARENNVNPQYEYICNDYLTNNEKKISELETVINDNNDNIVQNMDKLETKINDTNTIKLITSLNIVKLLRDNIQTGINCYQINAWDSSLQNEEYQDIIPPSFAESMYLVETIFYYIDAEKTRLYGKQTWTKLSTGEHYVRTMENNVFQEWVCINAV